MTLAAWAVLAAVLSASVGQEDADRAAACTCVPYYQCDQNETVIQNNVGIIDVSGQESKCDHYLEACCKKPRGPTPAPPASTRPPGRCGRRNEDGLDVRIKVPEGGEAQFGEFPWMAAVLREEPAVDGEAPATSYLCGGSLLHPSVVLTAAHCVARVRSDRLWVRLGEWDTQTTYEPLPKKDVRVVKVALHPDYRSNVLHNDVALLTLEAPVALADHIDVVCLPPQGAKFDGFSCFTTGWGKDLFGKEGRYQVILKKVKLPVIARSECVDRLRETRLGKFFELHDSFMCASGADVDTCQGDGGAPLMCPLISDPTRFQLVGVASWGIGCVDTPRVYANVAQFREWIDQQFLNANLNATYAI